MDTTQKQPPKPEKPIKKVFTNIFGATVDNTVHNINYNGNLSTSRTSQSIIRDVIIIIVIIGAFVIAWRAYLLCRKRKRSQNERTEERILNFRNKKIQTDIPIPPEPIPHKHTIQIE